MQTRRQSLIETCVSTAVGFGLSLVLQVAFATFYDYRTSLTEDTGIVAIFTIASLLRGYGMRRFFNWLWRHA